MKILIVDDEYYVREGMRSILKDSVATHELITAENGQQALEVCQSSPIDIVITDIRMPGMDGLEMAKEFRHLPDPPLVMIVSGFDDFSYAQTAIRLGVSDFLLKPIDPEELSEKVNALCEKRIAFLHEGYEDDKREALQVLRGHYLGPSQLLSKYSNETLLLFKWKGDEKDFWDWSNNVLMPSLAATLSSFCWLPIKEDIAVLLARPHVNSSQFQQDVEMSLNNCVFPLVVSIDTNISDAYESYLALEKRVQPWLYMPQHKIIEHDLLATSTLNVTDAQEYMVQIRSYLQRGSRLRLRQKIDQLFDKFTSSLYPQRSVLQCVWLIEAFCKQCLNQESNISDLPALAITDQMNIEQMRTALEDFILQYESLQYDFANRQDDAIYQAVAYIQDHYSENISLADMAKQMHVSQSYLSRKIKEVTQLGFSKYVLQLRMNRAALLLQQGYSVKQVSKMVGYNNYRQFSVQFREYTGCLPKKYAQEG